MRILGITIPEEKRLEIGLTTIFGVGRSRARTILEKAGVPIGKKSKELSIKEENKIWFSSDKEAEINGYTLAGNCIK